MAKGIKGVANSGTLHLPYGSADEMPWEEIEKQVRVKFDRHARQEIFGCWVRYHAHLSVEGARVPLAEIEELRRTIVDAAQCLLDVTARFRNLNGQPPSDRDEDVFLAVALSSEREKDLDLMALLHSLAPACQGLVDGLSENPIPDETSRLEPESVALASFVAAVLTGATKKPARRNPGFNTAPSSFEYERWGIALGPSVPKTVELAQAVLDRPVSPQQLKRAFGLARQRHPFI